METVCRLIVQQEGRQNYTLIEIILVHGFGYYWRYASESNVYKIGLIPPNESISKFFCKYFNWKLIATETFE